MLLTIVYLSSAKTVEISIQRSKRRRREHNNKDTFIICFFFLFFLFSYSGVQRYIKDSVVSKFPCEDAKPLWPYSRNERLTFWT